MKFSFYLIVITLAFFTTQYSFGQNWTGNSDSDWNNSANWSSWPLNGQNITINPSFYTGNAASPIISSNSVFSPAAILVDNGAVLTISANLTTQDDVEAIGVGSQIIMNNGTFSVNPGNGGRLIIDLGSSMEINGGTTLVDERFIAGEDALITINNGIASSGDRLLMDLGGRFIQNGGTVSVAQTFAMADGSLNYNSSYELNDGILNITGEMALENEFGDYQPTFTQNGGTLTVNGDIFWLGITPGLGTPKFLLNGGTANVSGIIQNMPASTVNLYLMMSGTSTMNYNGTLIETLHPEDSIIQNGLASFILTNANTINNAGVFQATNTLTTFNGTTTLQGVGTYQFSNVIIPVSKTLNHLNPSLISISGNITKHGNLLTNSNTIQFNGNQTQNLDGSGSFVLFNGIVDNSSPNGINLLIPMTIGADLQLINGKINTSTTAMLTIADNASSSPGNSNSFINGPMIKTGDDPFIFPTGKDSLWRRIGISAPTGVTSQFKAEYFNESFSSISPVNSPLSAVSNLEYWYLNQLSGNSNVTVELFWEDASQSAITDCAELSIANWDNIAWNNVLSIASGTCTGTGSGSIVSNSTLNNYGAFTYGFYAGVTSQNFSICNGDSVVVGSNIYYNAGIYIDVLQDINLNDSIVLTNITVTTPDVQIITGDVSFTVLGIADEYQWLDCANNYAIIPGETEAIFTPTMNGFYAIQVTLNSCIDTSTCFEVNYFGLDEFENSTQLSIYPNPFLDQLTIDFLSPLSNGTISITDLSGSLIYFGETSGTSTSGTIDLHIKSGIYFLHFSNDQIQGTYKIIRN